MTAAVVMSIVALVGAGITLIATLFQRKTLRTLAQQINNLETKLRESLQEVKPEASVASRFSAHLYEAEKKQDKNQEEYLGKSPAKPQGQSDKYRYAVALAAQGQKVDSIAQALNMAPAEVEQVMQLARVKR